jgi:hypothetical protein
MMDCHSEQSKRQMSPGLTSQVVNSQSVSHKETVQGLLESKEVHRCRFLHPEP